MSVCRWRLSHVLPSGVGRFVSLFNTERALFRKLIFIFLLLFWLFSSIVIVFIFFFSVALLLFLTFLRIFRVSLLQNFRIQQILLFNDLLHGHNTVLNSIATRLNLDWCLLLRLLAVIVGMGLIALLFLKSFLIVQLPCNFIFNFKRRGHHVDVRLIHVCLGFIRATDELTAAIRISFLFVLFDRLITCRIKFIILHSTPWRCLHEWVSLA